MFGSSQNCVVPELRRPLTDLCSPPGHYLPTVQSTKAILGWLCRHHADLSAVHTAGTVTRSAYDPPPGEQKLSTYDDLLDEIAACYTPALPLVATQQQQPNSAPLNKLTSSLTS